MAKIISNSINDSTVLTFNGFLCIAASTLIPISESTELPLIWVEKYLGNGNNIRFESPQRLIKQIAWPDPGLKVQVLL